MYMLAAAQYSNDRLTAAAVLDVITSRWRRTRRRTRRSREGEEGLEIKGAEWCCPVSLALLPALLASARRDVPVL